MKTVVKMKTPSKAKPGQLLSHHIEYDNEGDGATVSSTHQAEAGKASDPWTPGPSPSKKSFGSRMEAHHHMAQQAGVNAEIAQQAMAARAHGTGDSSDGMAGPGESEGDDDEDQAEDRGDASQPGAQAQMSMGKKPARKV